MNYISEYCLKLKTGEIIASKSIVKQYEKIESIVKGENPNYYYDEKKGNRVIKFIETFCKQSKGDWFGKPIGLMLFQKAKLQAVFGIVDRVTGIRKYREVFDLRARKNGKSTELAAISIYMLIADKEGGAEIYSAAAIKAQAKRIWEEAKNMILQSKDLQSILRPMSFEIKCAESFSTFKYLGKNTRDFDGLNASCINIDEVHELSREIYDILKQSTTARKGKYLINMITTAGFVRAGLFDDMYEYAKNVLNGIIEDEHFLPLLYEQESIEELENPATWEKSNPAIDIIKSRKDLIDNVERIKVDRNFANTVKVKDFNIVGVDNKSWLDYATIFNSETVDYGDYNRSVAIGGFDLSRTGDMTAFSAMFFDRKLKKFVIETMYWVTSDFLEKNRNSKVPYKQWIDRGLIRTSGTSMIDYHDLTRYVYREMFMKRGIMFQEIYYDSYSAQYVVEELTHYGYAKGHCLIPVIQGFKTLSVPMQTLEAHLRDKKVIYNDNPVTKWCLTNVELVQDRNGNYMPKKADDNKQRKIDGVSTIINCYVGVVKNLAYYESSMR